MKIRDLLSIQHVKIAHAESKKKALEILSILLTQDVLGVKAEEVFDILVAREKLGSTGVGLGIALPHARLNALHRTQIALLKLEQSVDFQAVDQKPVDLFLAILVPGEKNDHHLHLLVHLAEIFHDEKKLICLRACQNVDELFKTVIDLLGNYELPNEIALIKEANLNQDKQGE